MPSSLREAMEKAIKDQDVKQSGSMQLDGDGPETDQTEEVDTSDKTNQQSVDTTVEKAPDEKTTDDTGKQKQPDQKDSTTVQKQEGNTDGKDANTAEAPATWSKEEKAQWANVPPMARNAIHRVMTQSSHAALQAKQELADTKRQYVERETVLEPYNKLWLQNGVSPTQGLATAMKAVHEFERDPKGMLLKLAQQYGIDLTQQIDDQTADPLVMEVNQLKQQLNQFQQTQQQSQQSMLVERNMQDAQRFIDEKDANGSPLHPHWERVVPQMKALVPAVKAMDPNLSHQEVLARAYEMACQQNPEVRAELATSQSVQQQQKDYEQRLAASQRARSGVVSAPQTPLVGDGVQKKQAMSIRDSLKSALADGLGRV